MNVAALFEPRRVAVIGASAGDEDPWSFNARLTRAVLASSLDDVVLVNRSATEIAGRRAFAAIGDAPSGVEVAILAVPAAAVADAVDECAAAKVGGCVVITSNVPTAARDRMMALRSSTGMRFLGPNCVGFVNTSPSLQLFAGGTPPTRDLGALRVSAITQSGGFASSLIAAGEQAGLRFAHVFTTGDELDVGLEDCLEYVLDAGSSTAVVCFIESIRLPARFRLLARQAARAGVPLMVLRVGRTEVARDVALAHSGALVDDWAATEAALDADGVISCRTFQEVLDAAVVAASARNPIGRSVDIVSSSGAMGALAADLAADHGLLLERADRGVGAAVIAGREESGLITNPLDTSALGGSVATLRMIRQGLTAPDAPIGAPRSTIVFAHSGATYAESVADGLIDIAADGSQHVVACWPGLPADAAAVLARAGIPTIPDPGRALAALARLANWSEHLLVDDPSVDFDRTDQGYAGELLGYLMSRQLLAAWGTPAPRFARLDDPKDARAVTDRLTPPLAAKFAEGVNHKAALGGVVLGLRTADEVASAARGFRAAGYLGPVVVEEMLAPGVEVLVDVRRTPFGELLTIGWGGSATEEIADVQSLALPFDHEAFLRTFGRTKVAARLARVLANPAGAIDALSSFCLALVAALATAKDVWEVEVNPVIVNEDGAFAADARVIAAERPRVEESP